VEPLLSVRNLTVRFAPTGTPVLEGISFDVYGGVAAAILGESGCGKTTLARTLLGVKLSTQSVHKGSIRFRGTDLLRMSEKALNSIRGAGISMIPQEPELALNPVMRVGHQVEEVLRAHSQLNRSARVERVNATLAAVGLPVDLAHRYPHQLSGGQRQRIVIAQALVCRPLLLIADEPTSSLDNVLQAELLSLLKKLTQQFGLALLFITHNAALLDGLVQSVFVMKSGRIIESGAYERLRDAPKESYTADLLDLSCMVPGRGAVRAAGLGPDGERGCVPQ
jgi:ABC-type glutathione transport system ATPase component